MLHVMMLPLTCLGHMINLIAQQGLILLKAHIEKTRRAVFYLLASSPALCESRGMKMKCRKFKPYMKTHWNYTLVMLQTYYPVSIMLQSLIFITESMIAIFYVKQIVSLVFVRRVFEWFL